MLYNVLFLLHFTLNYFIMHCNFTVWLTINWLSWLLVYPYLYALLYILTIYAHTDVCQMDKHAGNCDDYGAVWYFERNSKTCRRFLYGGCGGNGNRFNTRDECVSTCINRPPPGPGREQGLRTAQPPTRPPTLRPRYSASQSTNNPQQPGDEEVVGMYAENGMLCWICY